MLNNQTLAVGVDVERTGWVPDPPRLIVRSRRRKAPATTVLLGQSAWRFSKELSAVLRPNYRMAEVQDATESDAAQRTLIAVHHLRHGDEFVALALIAPHDLVGGAHRVRAIDSHLEVSAVVQQNDVSPLDL